ncbi:hypothetical protein L4X63_22385 [Geomonas sp. Red32]|uniref:hypothetical protein n=1 Tax=Geomonas sp. Red32 TaxID=2912856 RepID=UPI00202CC3FF|nr:hypothetical protein [Geomonas sp. Red32]MCM0084337.1 hypothetical protein [Geomonas sp. Red32]
MMTTRLNQRLQIQIIFLVALSLLMAGVHVPDLSRPHRPKATNRTVVESQQKTVANCQKQQNDVVTVEPALVAATNFFFYKISDVVPPRYASPPTPSTVGRSPPTSIS